MAEIFRAGTRLPSLTTRALRGGLPVDLTAFVSITFKMTNGSRTVTGAARYDALGNLYYDWADGDLVVGEYTGRFRGLDGAGKPEVFPGEYNLTIVVIPDV